MSKYEVISGPNTGKYGPEITPYLSNFHAVNLQGYRYDIIFIDDKNLIKLGISHVSSLLYHVYIAFLFLWMISKQKSSI